MRKKVVLRNGDSARRIHSVYTKEIFFCIYIQFFYVSFVGMPRCFSFFFNVGVKASVLLRDFMVLLEHAWSWLRRMLMKLSLQFFCFPALSFRLCR